MIVIDGLTLKRDGKQVSVPSENDAYKYFQGRYEIDVMVKGVLVHLKKSEEEIIFSSVNELIDYLNTLLENGCISVTFYSKEELASYLRSFVENTQEEVLLDGVRFTPLEAFKQVVFLIQVFQLLRGPKRWEDFLYKGD